MRRCRSLEGSRDSLSYRVRLTGFSLKRPKSVMSGRCRSKTDFPKTPTAYRTDSVGGAKFVPPTVRCIVDDGRSQSADGRSHTAGRRHPEKMPTPNLNHLVEYIVEYIIESRRRERRERAETYNRLHCIE
jgi:hypothetical protein